MINLLFNHGSHRIGHGPHALADLCTSLQTTLKPDINIQVFIGTNPRLALDEIFTAKGPRLHTGVDFIACAIQKARVDKGNAGFCGANTLF